MKLALRGAVRGRRRRRGAVLRGRVRAGVGAVQPGLDHRRARAARRARSSRPIFYFLVRPLRRRVTDEQVALYLEEHEPSLQATLVSAVEASREGADPESAVLVRRLVEQALEACASTNAVAPRRGSAAAPLGRRRWPASRSPPSLIVLLGPAFLRNALSAILLVQRSVEAAAPYRIEVHARQRHRARKARTRR